jgi:BirA family biotin operon repressor/biotin-[acetyl-CoA-carboxylase] ligase
MSVLLRPAAGPVAVTAHDAVVATAVALSDAVAEVADVDARLKWPNDLVVGERKLAGMLAEVEGDAVVVGAGCNLNWERFPPELATTATACNLESGRAVDPDALLAAFLDRLGDALDAPGETRRAYRDRLVTVGQRVRVVRADGALEGDAVAVTDDGALTVRDDQGVDHAIVVGDVVHLRAAPA